MQPSCLMRIPGLIIGIQFIFSSGAWSKFADIPWLQKNYLLSFIPFLLFILIVLIFPSKDWKTEKNLSPSVAVGRKHFKYTLSSENCFFHSPYVTAFSFSNDSFQRYVNMESWANIVCRREKNKTILIEVLNFSRVTLYTFTVGFQPLPVQQILLQGNI